MIRKYGPDKELTGDEKVMTASTTCTIRKDGEKARIVEGVKYIVSGYYEQFDEVVFEPDKPVDIFKEEE